MFEFLDKEKLSLRNYAKETWAIMKGEFALTIMKNLLYEVHITKNEVCIYQAGNRQLLAKENTVKFKALLEMFRGLRYNRS